MNPYHAAAVAKFGKQCDIIPTCLLVESFFQLGDRCLNRCSISFAKSWVEDCLELNFKYIRESVDSLCRDGADAQYMQYLSKNRINFTTNTQKAYLSVQASSLSAFLISKTHISGQKPRGRQLNTKVCGSKSTIFLILSSLRLFSCFSNNDNSKMVQALTLILA